MEPCAIEYPSEISWGAVEQFIHYHLKKRKNTFDISKYLMYFTKNHTIKNNVQQKEIPN